MKRLLLVTDPIGGSTSVQFDILESLAQGLGPLYELTVYTPHCDPMRRLALLEDRCKMILPEPDDFPLNRFLQSRGTGNESMLWAESWTREAMFRRNSREAIDSLRSHEFDYVVNLSMTVPYRSDLWWVLGTPLDQTIRGMASVNVYARMVDHLAGRTLASLDGKLLHEIQSGTMRIVANSPYLRDLYRARGVPVEGVVYTLKDMSEFQPTTPSPRRDYVLLYVGKETDRLDFEALLDAGVKVVGFGSKIPTGTRIKRFTQSIEWLGRVSKRKLVDLYSNALFTLFPFTCEPMGLVPIESMACGTPVLTYDRQGPATTVVNNSTGWLVHTPDEMVKKATHLWQRGATGISPRDCVLRAQNFSGKRMVNELSSWIEGACPVDAADEFTPEPAWSATHVTHRAVGRA